MFDKIKRKDGSIVDFDSVKIIEDIAVVGQKTCEYGDREAKKLTLRVLTLAHEMRLGPLPETSDFEEITERVLLDSPYYVTARQYIIDNARPIYMKAFLEQYQDTKEGQIVKSIEFPPEYIQSGISILSFFARVLNKKCPDQKAKISIEQSDLKVKLIIDPLNGDDKEIIEKELTNYGLVIIGEMTPDEYTSDKYLALELKNELRLSHTRIQSLSDIIAYQHADIVRLNNLLEKVITAPSQKPPVIDIDVHVPVSTSAFAQSHQYIEISTQIDLLQEALEAILIQVSNNLDQKKYMSEVLDAANQMGNCSSKDEIANSSGLSKIRDFINGVEKAETTAGKIISTISDGVNTIRKFAGYYNKIAQWCGIPQIPEPFVKKG